MFHTNPVSHRFARRASTPLVWFPVSFLLFLTRAFLYPGVQESGRISQARHPDACGARVRRVTLRSAVLPRHRPGNIEHLRLQGGPWEPGPALLLRFFHNHAVFRLFQGKTPILSTFWDQGPPGGQNSTGPPDQKIRDPSLLSAWSRCRFSNLKKKSANQQKPSLRVGCSRIFCFLQMRCYVQKDITLYKNALRKKLPDKSLWVHNATLSFHQPAHGSETGADSGHAVAGQSRPSNVERLSRKRSSQTPLQFKWPKMHPFYGGFLLKRTGSRKKTYWVWWVLETSTFITKIETLSPNTGTKEQTFPNEGRAFHPEQLGHLALLDSTAHRQSSSTNHLAFPANSSLAWNSRHCVLQDKWNDVTDPWLPESVPMQQGQQDVSKNRVRGVLKSSDRS